MWVAGDHCYKRNTELPLHEQMISPQPDLETTTLTDDDEFIVLACDGIWYVYACVKQPMGKNLLLWKKVYSAPCLFTYMLKAKRMEFSTKVCWYVLGIRWAVRKSSHSCERGSRLAKQTLLSYVNRSVIVFFYRIARVCVAIATLEANSILVLYANGPFFYGQMFDHVLAPDTRGDGTGCDNMTAIIIVLRQPSGSEDTPSSTTGSSSSDTDIGNKRSLDSVNKCEVTSSSSNKRAKVDETDFASN